MLIDYLPNIQDIAVVTGSGSTTDYVYQDYFHIPFLAFLFCWGLSIIFFLALWGLSKLK